MTISNQKKTKGIKTMKIAILDDWLECALDSCDWNQLGADATIDVFHDTIAYDVRRIC